MDRMDRECVLASLMLLNHSARYQTKQVLHAFKEYVSNLSNVRFFYFPVNSIKMKYGEIVDSFSLAMFLKIGKSIFLQNNFKNINRK